MPQNVWQDRKYYSNGNTVSTISSSTSSNYNSVGNIPWSVVPGTLNRMLGFANVIGTLVNFRTTSSTTTQSQLSNPISNSDYTKGEVMSYTSTGNPYVSFNYDARFLVPYVPTLLWQEVDSELTESKKVTDDVKSLFDE